MAGGIVLVVGPSGAGKDTLIRYARAALAGDRRFAFPRRLVTRPSSEAEEHDTIDEDSFAVGVSSGAFALSWRAHGLGYAVPGSARDLAEAGRSVICNVSRTVIGQARELRCDVSVVEVKVPLDILRARLVARGRPEDGDIEKRLARAPGFPVEADLTIVNDRLPTVAGEELVRFLRRVAQGEAGPRPARTCASDDVVVR